MKTLRRIFGLSLATIMTLQAGSVVAQPKGKPKTIREELPSNAQKDWDAANELFDAGDFNGALVEYQRAYDLSKNPRTLYNLAICLKELKQYVRSIATLKVALASTEPKLSASDEARAKEAIEVIKPFVSSVEVSSNENGATLFVDGIESGNTPFVSPVPIGVGARSLVLHKDGFQDATLQVNVIREVVAKAAFKLAPLERKAVVSVAVEGAPVANVVIDGIDRGRAPFKGELSEGPHTIEARAPGFVSAQRTADVKHKENQDLKLSLSTERHAGKLRIVTTPPGASIEIDGRVEGSSVWQGVVTSGGGHQVVVKKTGYKTYSTEVFMKDDDTREIQAILQEDRGTGWVWWTVGAVGVIAGGAIASYFVFTPKESVPVTGNLAPGTTLANVPFR
ncbi:MAG: PEGA domain-containing protein [Polyangiaceae bacterium]